MTVAADPRRPRVERRHIREDTILVEQAVSYGKLKLQKTGRVYRTVDLLPELREDILTWCDMKDITRPDTPLFSRSDGGWMRLDDWKNWRRRSFNATTEAIGLGRPRPYDLRHSFASLMIRDGNTSIVELAEQRGMPPRGPENRAAAVHMALSMFESIDVAAQLASRVPKPGGHIATLDLQPDLGLCVAKTGGPSHWSVWGRPLQLEGCVTDVVKATA